MKYSLPLTCALYIKTRYSKICLFNKRYLVMMVKNTKERRQVKCFLYLNIKIYVNPYYYNM